MKLLIYKCVFTFCIVLLFASCEKEQNDRPLGVALEKVLAGNFWREEICLLYKDKGCDALCISRDLKSEFPNMAATFGDEMMLDLIYIEPETNLVRRYYLVKIMSEEPPWVEIGHQYCYLQNHYSIEYKESNAAVQISSPHPELAVRGAVTGSNMQVVSHDAEWSQIVFEAPLKEALSVWFQLEISYPDREYVGMKVIWTKTEPDALMLEAKPIG